MELWAKYNLQHQFIILNCQKLSDLLLYIIIYHKYYICICIGWITPYWGETFCCRYHKPIPPHTGVCARFCFFWVCILFSTCVIIYRKMRCLHGLSYVKTFSPSVAFTQWSHLVLSDLGYRYTRCSAVAHKKTELCCCTDLWFWWKSLDRKTGSCDFSAEEIVLMAMLC